MKYLYFLLFALLWSNLSFGQEVKLGMPPTLGANNLAFFENSGKYFLTTNEDLITVWDLNQFKPLVEIKFNGKITHFPEFNYESTKFVIAYKYQENQKKDWYYGLSVFNLLGEELIKIDKQKAQIDKVIFDNSGTKIYAFSRDGKINCWDAESSEHIKLIQFAQIYSETDVRIYAPPILNKVGNEVIINYMFKSGERFSTIINFNTGKTIFSRSNSYSSAYFDNESKIVTSSAIDSTLLMWDIKTGELVKTISTNKELVYILGYNNGQRLIGMSHSDSIYPIYDLERGVLLNEIKTDVGTTGMFLFLNKSEDKILVSGNKATNIFNASNGDFQYKLPYYQAFFNVSGNKILCTSRRKIAIFDVETGQELNSYLVKDAFWSANIPIIRNNEIELYPDGSSYDIDIEPILFDADKGVVKSFLNIDRSNLIFEEKKGVFRILKDNTSIDGDYLNSIISKKENQNVPSVVYENYKINISYGMPWDSTIVRVQIGNEKEIRVAVKELVDQFILNKVGNKILIHSDDILTIWDLNTGQELSRHEDTDKSYFNSDANYLLVNSSYKDYSYLIDLKTERRRKLEGKGQILIEKSKVLTCSKSNAIRIYDLFSGNIIITSQFVQSDHNKWIHYLPSGLFDASPKAMELMYWTKGLEVIEFAQLKDRYWVPGLWEKVMKGEPLPNVGDMQELKLQPEVEMGEMKDGKIPVTLTKREGGYGKVSILINGKEIQADARGNNFDKSKETQTIWVDLKDHPNLQNGENTIAVKASSEDGFVVGRPEEKKVTMSFQTAKPHFYAVVVGTGKYMNSSINLKYPEKDAESMAKALQLGSEKLFGKENTHIYTLTTASTERPTKEKIKSVFTEIGKTAKSSDVVLVYLSGHGVAWGGDQGDFYYVTTDATAANAEAYNDEAIRKNYTVSTTEFTEYLKAIPANKQVMIIDACASGKAVDNLMAARDIDVSSIKAIDRMKDRTGMFVISGSSADAVSYEASRYGQGLLTYSILQAMKGASLRDGEFFDVNMLLNYARENVPKLAAGIGGIQTPQLLVPKGGSFDIGKVDSLSKIQIPLSSIKPVFVRTSFMDTEDYTDVLSISKSLDDQLNEFAIRGKESEIVFLDTREFPDAYRLSGGYTQSNGTITLKLKIKGPKENEHQLTGKKKEELIQQIMDIVESLE
jgi:WD40 repeat protein